jgi:hypothetical protein
MNQVRLSALARLLGLILLAALQPAEAALSFGIRTQIWPFLFKEAVDPAARYTTDEAMKLEVALGNLDRYATLGASWNIVDLWQEVDGPDGFRRMDRVVAEHERRGIAVALRLLETPELYDGIAAGGGTSREALERYRGWVKRVARRYGSRARYYMVSNEVDHDIGYNRPSYRPFRRVTAEEYGAVLRAAHAAVKAAGPRLVVADHGPSSWSLALVVMADLVLAGRPGDALGFWRSMDYDTPGDGERTLPRLLAMLANSDSRRRIEFTTRVTADLGPWRDVYQLHHYYGPATLPAVIDWVRARTAANPRPLVAAELGFLVPAKPGKSWDGRTVNVADMARYSEDGHAASLAKMVATLGGLGVEDILYWQLRFHVAHSPAASLYRPTATRDDFRSTRAVAVFRALTSRLTGAESVPAPAVSGAAGLVEYRFRRDGEVSLVWSADGAPRALPAAARAGIARVTGADGGALKADTRGAVVGAEPVFVDWRTTAASP